MGIRLWQETTGPPARRISTGIDRTVTGVHAEVLLIGLIIDPRRTQLRRHAPPPALRGPGFLARFEDDHRPLARPLAGVLPAGLARLHWPDSVRPHHLVVLVLDDVAVPNKLPGVDEAHPQSGDLPWIGDDRVLPSVLPGRR